MAESETVTVKALLDAQGNGAFPSDTNIITHDGIPLRDYINKSIYKVPYGYELSPFGLVMLDNVNIDMYKSTMNAFTVNCTGYPINSNGYLKVDAVSEMYCLQTFSEIVNNNVWQRRLIDGTWSIWKLLAGEVELWNGSVSSRSSTINCNVDLKVFSGLRGIVDGMPVYGKLIDGNAMMCGRYNGINSTGTVDYMSFLSINGTNATLVSDVGSCISTYGGSQVFSLGNLTRLYGCI